MKRRTVTLLLGLLLFLVWTNVASALPPVRRTILQNDAVLLTSQEHSLPFITVYLLLGSGSKDDPEGKEGLADLTASSLIFGAGGMSFSQVTEELDFIGATITTDATKDYTVVALRVLKKDFERVFPIFLNVVTKPGFAEREVKQQVLRTAGQIQAAEDQPGVVAEKAFTKALHKGSAGYGHPTEGSAESVSKLTRESVVGFHRTHYYPANCIMTVVGDIDDKTVARFIIPMFEKWPKRPADRRKPPIEFAAQKRTVKINRPVTQSNIVIGNRGMSRDNPDYYAATVMNHIFGGSSLRSRLMEDIRNKRGLAYSVASVFEARKYAGSFQVFLQTKNASSREAIGAVTENMERMRTELVSESELRDAKKYLVGSFPQRFSSQSRIASFFTLMEYYGLGLDYPEKYPGLINAVTREDVLRVAAAYLRPQEYITVIVADLKEAGIE